MKSTFRILFYGRANAVSQDGTIPLTARVTISREMNKLSETLSGTSFSLSGGEGEAEGTDASTEIATETDSSVSSAPTPNI